MWGSLYETLKYFGLSSLCLVSEVCSFRSEVAAIQSRGTQASAEKGRVESEAFLDSEGGREEEAGARVLPLNAGLLGPVWRASALWCVLKPL